MDDKTIKIKLQEIDAIASEMRAHIVKVDECQMSIKEKVYDMIKELK